MWAAGAGFVSSRNSRCGSSRYVRLISGVAGTKPGICDGRTLPEQDGLVAFDHSFRTNQSDLACRASCKNCSDFVWRFKSTVAPLPGRLRLERIIPKNPSKLDHYWQLTAKGGKYFPTLSTNNRYANNLHRVFIFYRRAVENGCNFHQVLLAQGPTDPWGKSKSHTAAARSYQRTGTLFDGWLFSELPPALKLSFGLILNLGIVFQIESKDLITSVIFCPV